MNERQKTGYPEVSARVERVRRMYSRIGEPLPADVLIDLYRHLGAALDQAQTQKQKPGKKNMTS